jgi:hypothetical protein
MKLPYVTDRQLPSDLRGGGKLVERQTLSWSPIAGESGGLTSGKRAARDGQVSRFASDRRDWFNSIHLLVAVPIGRRLNRFTRAFQDDRTWPSRRPSRSSRMTCRSLRTDIDRNFLRGSSGLADGSDRPRFIVDVGVPNSLRRLVGSRQWVCDFKDVAVSHSSNMRAGPSICQAPVVA